MRRPSLWCLIAITVGAATPSEAADFVVVSARGVTEPAGLTAGRELEAGVVLRLEPWGRAAIRESGGCGLTHIVVGAAEHALTPTRDCSAVAQPAEVAGLVQQGAVFVTWLDETETEGAGELVQMLANEPCVFLARVSEEGGNARECPSGYALRGLRCSGEYCDDKDLLCCPYLGGAPDATAKQLGSQVISEEFPNIFKTKRFLNGLACNGDFCDNILPYQFKSSRLENSKQCEWSPWSSERPGQWIDCGDGQFASGIRCRIDYCGEVGLYCCGAAAE